MMDNEEWAELLQRCKHEAAEYRRVWGIVDELATYIQQVEEEERLLEPLLEQLAKHPSLAEQNERIARLEQKIVSQRRAIRQLEECRGFEQNTERFLVNALKTISMTRYGQYAQGVLAEWQQRKGPRPQEEDVQA